MEKCNRSLHVVLRDPNDPRNATICYDFCDVI